ncbi:MAG: hypothetical protein STSR0004_22990 [Peptococcaceae bacterium]
MPHELRNSLSLYPGDKVEFIETGKGTWAIRKLVPEGSFKKFIGAFRAKKQLPLDANEYIDEIRGILLSEKEER